VWGPGRENLLDVFLRGGAEAVYEKLTGDEFDLYQVIVLLNQRLYPLITLSINYPSGGGFFDHSLGSQNYLPNVKVLTFRFAVGNHVFNFNVFDNTCHILWDAHAPYWAGRFESPADAINAGDVGAVIMENLARELTDAIRDIPSLIQEYPVWNWRPLD